MLGVIALGGMIMRNSLILIDQIEQEMADGRDALECRASTPRCAGRVRWC